jgi:hypothetical protein
MLPAALLRIRPRSACKPSLAFEAALGVRTETVRRSHPLLLPSAGAWAIASLMASEPTEMLSSSSRQTPVSYYPTGGK